LHPLSAESGGRAEARPGSLAERLLQGTLSLDEALRCAVDIAAALRELHENGRVHGRVEPQNILLNSIAKLEEPAVRVVRATPGDDIAAFGRVLHQMLTGQEPPASQPMPAKGRWQPGPSGIRAGAMRLAARCREAGPGRPLTMQRVSIEVRLLRLTAKHTPGCATVPDPPTILPPGRLMEPIVAPPLPAEPPAAEPVASQPPPAPVIEPVAASNSVPPPDGAPEPPRVHSTCPNCSGTLVYESRARTRFEQFLGWLGAPLRRCHRCYYRYLEIFGFTLGKESLE
jgi:hypothetical protein